MAIRVSGVEFVLKNLAGFLSGLDKGEKGYKNLGDAASKMMQKVKVAGEALTKAYNSQTSAQMRVTTASIQLNAATGALEYAEGKLIRTAERGRAGTEKLAKLQLDAEKAAVKQAVAYDSLTSALAQLNTAEINVSQKTDVLHQREAELEGQTQSLTQKFLGLLGGTLSLSAAFPELAPVVTAVGVAFGVAKIGADIFGKAMEMVKGIISSVMSILASFGNAAKSVFSFFIGILAKATAPLRTFLQHVLEIASGIALWRAIRNAGAAVRALTDEVMDAIAVFQQLDVRLSAIAARDYAEAFGTTITEAFQKTVGASKELFNWLRKLAVETPFSMEDVSTLFALANVMGLSIPVTKQLTTALSDWGAAFALSDEAMWRCIYDLGQMIQNGRISGDTLRYLSKNMFPVMTIFKEMGEEAGMTAQEMRELATSGKVDVMDFINKFIVIAERDFPEAAEEMAKTWRGVVNNTKDFIQTFLGVDFIKPLFDKISEIASNTLQGLIKNTALQTSFKLFGQTLLRAFEYITPFVDKLVNAVFQLGGAFGFASKEVSVGTQTFGKMRGELINVYNWAKIVVTWIATGALLIGRGLDKATTAIQNFSKTSSFSFSTLIGKAYEWGIRFLGEFSKGIAWAINSLLIPAINIVKKILTMFFKPGSPPLVAPDIDKWGAETMNEWLKGFTLADFDIFNDVAGLVQSYLQSIKEKIGETNVIPVLLDVRGTFAQAIDQYKKGALDMASAVRSVVDAIGYSQGDFTNYITSLFQISKAEEAVAAAGEKVKAAQKAVSDLRDAYNALSDSSPALIMAELEVKSATQQVTEAQNALNKVTEKYDAILNSLRAQLVEVTTGYDETVRLREIDRALSEEVLTADERERLEMEKKGILIQREIRTVEGQRDAELSVAEQRLKDAKDAQDAAQAKIDAIKTEIEEQQKLLQIQIDAAEVELASAQAEQDVAKEYLASLQSQSDAYRALIEAQIESNRLIQEQLDLLAKLEEETPEVAEQPGYAAPEPAFDLEGYLKGLNSIWADAQKNVDALLSAWQNLTSAWGEGGAPSAITNLSEALKGLTDIIPPLTGEDGWLNKLKTKWGEANKFIRDTLGVPADKSIFKWASDELSNAWEVVQRIGEPFGLRFLTTGIILNTGAKLFVDAFDNIANASGRMGKSVDTNQPKWLEFASWFVSFPFMVYAADFLAIATALNFFTASWSAMIGIAVPAAKLILVTIWEVIKALTVMLTGTLADASRQIVDSLTTIKDQFAETNRDMLASWQAFGDDMVEITQALKDILVGHSIIPDMMEGIEGSVTGGIASTQKKWAKGLSSMNKSAELTMGGITPLFNSTNVFQAQPVYAQPAGSYGNIDQSTHVEVNPTYKNVESEASVYYDVAAALAATWR